MYDPITDARDVLDALAAGEAPDPDAAGRVLIAAASQDAELIVEIRAAEITGDGERAAALRAIRIARDADLPPEGIVVASLAAAAKAIGLSEAAFVQWGTRYFVSELGHANAALFVEGCIAAQESGIGELWPFGRPPSPPAPLPPVPMA